MDDKTRAKKILQALKKAYPDAPPTYLDFKNPFEMLIATILSAHTTDSSVNKVTPNLFKKYPTPKKMAAAKQEDLIAIIRPVGTYNVKSKYILNTAKQIVDEFAGEIPSTLDDLIKFQGVSRKTANVVLSVAFDKNEGVVVDTHIMRVTLRLGFSEHEKKAKKIEKDLMALLPQNQWGEYARLIGAHGRVTCKSRKPKCSECTVSDLCPSAELA
jgi:endonuclease-3